jgi:hypothetical protein
VKDLDLIDLIEKDPTTVKVADGRHIQIHGKISLIIGFNGDDGERTCATLSLRILDGLSLPLVIGIVSILEHFKELYISMLHVPSETNKEENVEFEDSVNVIDGKLNMEELESLKRPLEVPWAGEVDENVEEIDIPESNGFQTLGNELMSFSSETIEFLK